MRIQTGHSIWLSNTLGKKLENLEAAVALYFHLYNFVKIYTTLLMTLAMKAGITKYIWFWEELLEGVRTLYRIAA